MEGDLHSLFVDNEQLFDNDTDLDDQEYKIADIDIDINSDNVITDFCSGQRGELAENKHILIIKRVIKCCLTPNSAIFQLYHGEIKKRIYSCFFSTSNRL